MMALLIEFSDFSSTIDSIDVGMGMCPAFQFTASTVITIAITSSRLHLTNRWFLGFMMARRHESRGPSPSFIHCSLANYFYDAVVVSLSGRLTKSVNRNNSTKKYSSNQIKEKYEERKRKEKKRRKRNPDGVKRNEIPLLASFDSTDDGRLPVVRCRLPVAGCRLPVAGCPGFGGSPGRARGVDSRAIIGFPAGHFLTGWTFVQSRKPPILTHCGLQHYTSIIINDNNWIESAPYTYLHCVSFLHSQHSRWTMLMSVSWLRKAAVICSVIVEFWAMSFGYFGCDDIWWRLMRLYCINYEE